jgi:hypothetical protein
MNDRVKPVHKSANRDGVKGEFRELDLVFRLLVLQNEARDRQKLYQIDQSHIECVKNDLKRFIIEDFCQPHLDIDVAVVEKFVFQLKGQGNGLIH